MRKCLFFVLIVLLIISVIGGTVTAQDKKFKIAYVPTTMNNAFWLALEGPIKEEVEKRGDEYISIDAQSDQARMNDMIGDLIAQKIDILLVAPQDSAGIESALVACKDAGIKVVNFDTPVVNTDLVETIVASDNYNAGVVVAEDMMKRLEKGQKLPLCILQPAAHVSIVRTDFTTQLKITSKLSLS